MKKLLNNPYAVVVLAIAAVMFVSRNVITNFLGEETEIVEDDDSWDEFSDANAEARLIGIEQLSSVDSAAVVWLSTPRRDPFSPFQTFSGTEQIASQGFYEMADSPRRPRLSALVVGERTNFAVLDGRIVRAGESIGGFWIEKISAAGVDVMADGQRFRIKPNE